LWDWQSKIPALRSAGSPLELTDVDRLLEAAGKNAGIRIVERSQVTGLFRQWVYAARIMAQTYLADLDAGAVGFSAAHQPVVDMLSTGFVFDLRAVFSSPGEPVSMELRSSWCEAQMQRRTEVGKGMGPIDLAQYASLKWQSDLSIPDEKIVLASLATRGSGEESEELIFLVRCRPRSK
jgi:hypothetical protein